MIRRNLKQLEKKNRSKNNEKLKKKIFFQTLKNAPWQKKNSQKFRGPVKSLVPFLKDMLDLVGPDWAIC